MPVRLKDIALDLGVSMMTVSKALRGEAGIGAKTRERVVRRAAELGYQPNRAARALVTGRSRAVGFMVPDLVHPFFSQVARGLSRVLQTSNYGLVIASSDEDSERERAGVDLMLSQRVDALIVATVQPDADRFAHVKADNVPLVLIDRLVPGLRAGFVGNDDRAIGYLATQHLAKSGFTRIAHIRGGATSPAKERLAGYREALGAYKLPWRPSMVTQADAPDRDGIGGGVTAMRQLLALSPRPDAVFCFNDSVAFGAMRAVFDCGLKIPEDVAIVGCGNFPHDDLLAVPLSSVDQGCDQIGARAGEMVLELLSGTARREARSITIAPTLVERRSSARVDAASAETKRRRPSAKA